MKLETGRVSPYRAAAELKHNARVREVSIWAADPARGNMYPNSHPQSRALYDRAHSLPGGNTRTTVFAKPFPIYAARRRLPRLMSTATNTSIASTTSRR